jgi:hypothetical protein
MKDYQTFKTFTDRETAENFADVLQQHGIRFSIEEDRLTFDPSYAHNPLNKDYLIKISPGDFTRAHAAYEDYFALLVDKAEPDYYLYTFSDEELVEIVTKPDEWGTFDNLLAQKLLAERGISFSPAEKKALNEKRYQQLQAPKNEATDTILGYYLVSLLFFPVGIVIGRVWAYSKKTLPDGERVPVYNQQVQQHGRNLFRLAVFIFVVFVILLVSDTLLEWR